MTHSRDTTLSMREFSGTKITSTGTIKMFHERHAMHNYNSETCLICCIHFTTNFSIASGIAWMQKCPAFFSICMFFFSFGDLLFGAVNELILVTPLEALLNTSILPKGLDEFIKLLKLKHY